jgi:hypothetical protein
MLTDPLKATTIWLSFTLKATYPKVPFASLLMREMLWSPGFEVHGSPHYQLCTKSFLQYDAAE